MHSHELQLALSSELAKGARGQLPDVQLTPLRQAARPSISGDGNEGGRRAIALVTDTTATAASGASGRQAAPLQDDEAQKRNF